MKTILAELIIVLIAVAALSVIISAPLRESVRSLLGFFDEDEAKDSENKEPTPSDMINSFNKFVSDLQRAMNYNIEEPMRIDLNYDKINEYYFSKKLGEYSIKFDDLNILFLYKGEEIGESKVKIKGIYVSFNEFYLDRNATMKNYIENHECIDLSNENYIIKESFELEESVSSEGATGAEVVEIEHTDLTQEAAPTTVSSETHIEFGNGAIIVTVLKYLDICDAISQEETREALERKKRLDWMIEEVQEFMNDERKALVFRLDLDEFSEMEIKINETEKEIELVYAPLGSSEKFSKFFSINNEIMIENSKMTPETKDLLLLKNCSEDSAMIINFTNIAIRDDKFSTSDSSYPFYEEECSKNLQNINNAIDYLSQIPSDKDYALINFKIADKESLYFESSSDRLKLESEGLIFPQYSKKLPFEIEFKILGEDGNLIEIEEYEVGGSTRIRFSKYYQERNPGSIIRGKNNTLYITEISKGIGAIPKYGKESGFIVDSCYKDYSIDGIIRILKEGGEIILGKEELFSTIELIEYNILDESLLIDFKGEMNTKKIEADIRNITIIYSDSFENNVREEFEASILESMNFNENAIKISFRGGRGDELFGIEELSKNVLISVATNEKSEKTLIFDFERDEVSGEEKNLIDKIKKVIEEVNNGLYISGWQNAFENDIYILDKGGWVEVFLDDLDFRLRTVDPERYPPNKNLILKGVTINEPEPSFIVIESGKWLGIDNSLNLIPIKIDESDGFNEEIKAMIGSEAKCFEINDEKQPILLYSSSEEVQKRELSNYEYCNNVLYAIEEIRELKKISENEVLIEFERFVENFNIVTDDEGISIMPKNSFVFEDAKVRIDVDEINVVQASNNCKLYSGNPNMFEFNEDHISFIDETNEEIKLYIMNQMWLNFTEIENKKVLRIDLNEKCN